MSIWTLYFAVSCPVAAASKRMPNPYSCITSNGNITLLYARKENVLVQNDISRGYLLDSANIQRLEYERNIESYDPGLTRSWIYFPCLIDGDAAG
jgi:hypothetical protein